MYDTGYISDEKFKCMSPLSCCSLRCLVHCEPVTVLGIRQPDDDGRFAACRGQVSGRALSAGRYAAVQQGMALCAAHNRLVNQVTFRQAVHLQAAALSDEQMLTLRQTLGGTSVSLTDLIWPGRGGQLTTQICCYAD